MFIAVILMSVYFSNRHHDDIIKWKHFLRYWPFVRRIHRWPVNSPHKCQWRGAFIFSFICAWVNGWVHNREADCLRRHRTHYDVTIIYWVKNLTKNAELSARYMILLIFVLCCGACGWLTSSWHKWSFGGQEMMALINESYGANGLSPVTPESVTWLTHWLQWSVCLYQDIFF